MINSLCLGFPLEVEETSCPTRAILRQSENGSNRRQCSSKSCSVTGEALFRGDVIRLADANDPDDLDALKSHNHLGPAARGEGLKEFHISPIASSLLPLAFPR